MEIIIKTVKQKKLARPSVMAPVVVEQQQQRECLPLTLVTMGHFLGQGLVFLAQDDATMAN